MNNNINRHFFKTRSLLQVLIFCTTNKMTNVFKDTLNIFITASKIVGLIHCCCTMETGILYRNNNLTYNLFLELLRMFVFLICSYQIIFNMECYYWVFYINIFKYWSIVIAARISEKWIIK